jgi:pyridoxamine 5'-phosphate oxidase family protein
MYGRASDPVQRTGIVGPGFYFRVTPVTSWSWNMDGEPAGDTWYVAQRSDHDPEPASTPD